MRNSGAIVCGLATWIVGVSRELIEQSLVVRLQRRAVQLCRNRIDVLVQEIDAGGHIGDDAVESIREADLECLEGEAAEVVALHERLRIVRAAGQVAHIDASKGIGSARVASQLERLGVLSILSSQVGKDGCYVVGVRRRATVPVLWDLFLTLVPDKRARLTRYAKERL